MVNVDLSTEKPQFDIESLKQHCVAFMHSKFIRVDVYIDRYAMNRIWMAEWLVSIWKDVFWKSAIVMAYINYMHVKFVKTSPLIFTHYPHEFWLAKYKICAAVFSIDC